MNKYIDLEKLKEYIKPEELQYPLNIIAEKAGVDTALEIYKEFMSMSLYIPESAINRARERYIAENYDGSNVKQLSQVVGFSERHVWRVLNKKVSEMKQMTLSDVDGS